MNELTLNGADHSVPFGGFTQQRDLLREVIDLKLVKNCNKVRIKGVLLHGPSGIGKTKAIETVL